MQLFIVTGLFFMAIAWMGMRLYRSVWGKGKGCEGCATAAMNRRSSK